MGDSLSKIVAGFLAAILLFIFPLMYMAEKQEDTTLVYVLTETTRFVDSVRDIGYITEVMYNEFLTKLAATGVIYDIEMEHRHKVYNPSYGNPLDADTFLNDFEVHYDGYYTDDIINQFTSGDYLLSKGDYFLIKVVNKNQTFAGRVRELILGGTLPEETIFVRYGGVVRFENY